MDKLADDMAAEHQGPTAGKSATQNKQKRNIKMVQVVPRKYPKNRRCQIKLNMMSLLLLLQNAKSLRKKLQG